MSNDELEDKAQLEQKLRDYIQRHEHSMAGLAHKLQVDRALVHRWVTGERPLPQWAIWRLQEEWKLTDLETAELFKLAGYPVFTGNSFPHQHYGFYPRGSKPRYYIERSEVLANIRGKLLNSGAATSRRQPALALHGMGGIGKTVLANALCDDPEIHGLFRDGILWVTLGKPHSDPSYHPSVREQQLIPKMRDWITALGGTVTENSPTIIGLQYTLTSLLQDRACLLVLDDVWLREDARAFLVGGPNCRVLLTTRDSEIAYEIGALVEPIPLMSESEAIILLEQWADGHLSGIDSKIKKRIIKRLGSLPLAVKLAGAQLRYQTPENWLRTFDVRKLKALRLESHHDSLEATFQMSLNDLVHSVRRLYISLAIFREDDLIPETVVAHLWQGLEHLDEYETAEKLYDLAARALLTLITHPSPPARAIQLHDLLHEFISTELGDQTSSIHQTLLDAYRHMQQTAGWHTVADDGYLYDHLVYHLQEAGATEEVQALFATPQWMQVRAPQRAYTYDGYLEDLQKVWEDAIAETKQQIEAHQEPTHFAGSIHYLLISTSINSLAANYIPDLVARAVKEGIWSSQRALDTCSRIPDKEQLMKMSVALLQTTCLSMEQRNDAQRLGLQAALTLQEKRRGESTFLSLASRLPEPLLEPALQAILAMDNEADRKEAIVALASRLPEPLLVQAWQAIFAFQNKWYQTEALIALTPRLPDHLQALTLQAILTFHNEQYRGEALVALAPRLPEPLLEQALQVALSLSNENYRKEAFIRLAPRLSESLLAQVWQSIFAFQNQWCQTEALVALAPRLPELLLPLAMQIVLAFHREKYRGKALIALAPRLSEPLLEQALEIALALNFEADRKEAIVALAPRLPEPLLAQAWQATLAFYNEQYQREALIALAPKLSESLLEQALEIALALNNEIDRKEAIVALAPRLPEPLLAKVWPAVLAFYNQQYQKEVLIALASRLPEPLLLQAWNAALALDDERNQKETITLLASRLTRPRFVQAWQVILAEGSERHQKGAIVALAPQLPESLLGQALKAVLAFHDAQYRSEAFLALVPRFPEPLLEQTLRVILSLYSEDYLKKALIALTPRLPEYLLEQALHVVLSLVEDNNRKEALVLLVPRLPEPLLTWAWQTTLAFHDQRCQKEVLIALAPRLPEPFLLQAWKTALALELEWYRRVVLVSNFPYVDENNGEWFRKRTLAALIPRMKGPLLEQALQATLALDNEDQRRAGLIALAPQVTGPLLEQAVQGGRALLDEKYRSEALASLVPRLLEPMITHNWQETLAWGNEWYRSEILVALAPRFTEALLEQALGVALALNNEVYREKVLIALASRLPLPLLIQAWRGALALQGNWSGEQALIALAPRFTGPLLEQALEVALLLDHEDDRKKALTVLAPRLTGPLLAQALQADPADRLSQVLALTVLIPHLTNEKRTMVMEHALKIIQTQNNEEQQAKALVALIPQLSGTLLGRALQATLAIRYEQYRTNALSALVPALDSEQRRGDLAQVLEVLEAIPSTFSNVEVLRAVAPHMSEKSLERTLQATLELSIERQAEILAVLAPHLEAQQRFQILQRILQAALATKTIIRLSDETLVLSIPDNRILEPVLIKLATQWTGRLLEPALQAALALESNHRSNALAALVPYLTGELLEQAIQAALALSVKEGHRAHALVALLPQVSADQRSWVLEQALQAALAVDDMKKQLHALAALSPFAVNQPLILKSIRLEVTNYILSFRYSSRRDLFQGCLIESDIGKLLAPPILPSETLDAIASHIVTICEGWHWL